MSLRELYLNSWTVPKPIQQHQEHQEHQEQESYLLADNNKNEGITSNNPHYNEHILFPLLIILIISTALIIHYWYYKNIKYKNYQLL